MYVILTLCVGFLTKYMMKFSSIMKRDKSDDFMDLK